MPGLRLAFLANEPLSACQLAFPTLQFSVIVGAVQWAMTPMAVPCAAIGSGAHYTASRGYSWSF